MNASEFNELGFEDTEGLEKAACEMLDSLCGTKYATGDLVAQALARSYISSISADSVEDMGNPWHGASRLEEFCDDLLALLKEEGIPQERLAAAFASSIADNAYRKAVADLDWAYEHLSSNLGEDMSVGDFCPDVDVASLHTRAKAVRSL